MALYKRGGVWWYEFVFGGQRIRRSTKTGNKEVAKRAAAARLLSLQEGANGLEKIKQPLIFSEAAKKWQKLNEPHWSVSNVSIVKYNLKHLGPHFAGMMLSDIKVEDISHYQGIRLKEKASPKSINLEVGTLRAILRKNRLWANIQPDVKMLKARTDVGRALSDDEFHRVLTACKNSGSRSLYPAVLVSLHTGLRNCELRLLRWRQIDLLEPKLTVGRSKTAGGDGRIVPLSKTALRCLMDWCRLFPNALPAHYVFPSERYGYDGEDGHESGLMISYEVKPTVPIGSWKTAWRTARKAAKVECRWHDMRHTFVSKMAAGKASDATIMSMSGHLSRKMLERYSHTQNEAKREAISVFDLDSPQIPPQ
jgi:integrase